MRGEADLGRVTSLCGIQFVVRLLHFSLALHRLKTIPSLDCNRAEWPSDKISFQINLFAAGFFFLSNDRLNNRGAFVVFPYELHFDVARIFRNQMNYNMGISPADQRRRLLFNAQRFSVGNVKGQPVRVRKKTREQTCWVICSVCVSRCWRRVCVLRSWAAISTFSARNVPAKSNLRQNFPPELKKRVSTAQF